MRKIEACTYTYLRLMGFVVTLVVVGAVVVVGLVVVVVVVVVVVAEISKIMSSMKSELSIYF